MMSGIRGKDTKPELLVRRALHARGFRYRLYVASLPGKPDLVLPKYNAVVFVHGCFWHGHDCHLFNLPGTRREFWSAKIASNKERDKQSIEELEVAGWRVMQIWECALRGKERIGLELVSERTSAWLISNRKRVEIRGRKPRK